MWLLLYIHGYVCTMYDPHLAQPGVSIGNKAIAMLVILTEEIRIELAFFQCSLEKRKEALLLLTFSRQSLAGCESGVTI